MISALKMVENKIQSVIVTVVLYLFLKYSMLYIGISLILKLTTTRIQVSTINKLFLMYTALFIN